MFLQASVILSTGGVSASAHAGVPPPPRSRHAPPGADTPPPPQSRQSHPAPPGSDMPPPQSRHPLEQIPPWEQTPPPVQSMLGDTVNARAVRILLECNLVVYIFSAREIKSFKLQIWRNLIEWPPILSKEFST